MEGGRGVWGFPLSSRACKGIFLKSLMFLILYISCLIHAPVTPNPSTPTPTPAHTIQSVSSGWNHGTKRFTDSFLSLFSFFSFFFLFLLSRNRLGYRNVPFTAINSKFFQSAPEKNNDYRHSIASPSRVHQQDDAHHYNRYKGFCGRVEVH